VAAVIRVESGFNPRAISPKGARGLMQLMPGTASSLGVRDTFDPRENIDGGVRHLRALMERFGSDLPLVLAAYNAGERAVTGHGGIPPYAETRDYVRRVLRLVDGGILDGFGHPVYRTVANDGTVTYTNIPPRARN
jgi:soluble lytic murein transglycosylase-like protein